MDASTRLPFDNQVAVLTLTGAELKRAIKQNLQGDSAVMSYSGIRVVATCDRGQLQVVLERSSKRQVNDGDVLKVVTNEFLATGGDDFLKAVMPLRIAPSMDGTLVRDRIADWLTRNGGSWRAADLFDPANRRLIYPGERPVRCDAGS